MSVTHCRIYGIVARAADACVIFRRGPSKWTHILKWDTHTDKVVGGAWFHGRIYERRCDLSPDGEHLIYFASNQSLPDDSSYTCSWTAISKPPRLTALALWPKGDCWHGGGLFENNKNVSLNHHPFNAIAHPNHPARGFRVKPNWNVYGEDEPILNARLERDGWKFVQRGTYTPNRSSVWLPDKPDIRQKQLGRGRCLRNELRELNFNAIGGPYIEAYCLIMQDGSVHDMPDVSWAEGDNRGGILFARKGCIYHGRFQGQHLNEQLIADLDQLQPPCATDQSR